MKTERQASVPARKTFVEHMRKEGRRVTPDRGAVVYLADDEADKLYFVEHGVVKLFRMTRTGREIVLDFVPAGVFFGELALIDSRPRDHFAEAHEDSLLYAVPAAALVQLADRHAESSLPVIQIVADQLRSLHERLENLAAPGSVRLARALLSLSRKHGVRESEAIRIALRLRHQDLADLVGLSREATCSYVSAFKRRGLVRVDRRVLRLLDPEGLAALSEAPRSFSSEGMPRQTPLTSGRHELNVLTHSVADTPRAARGAHPSPSSEPGFSLKSELSPAARLSRMLVAGRPGARND